MALNYNRLHQRGGAMAIPPAIQALQNLLNGLQAGELLTGDGNGNPVVVPVGTDGLVLTPDSTSPTGFSYQTLLAQPNVIEILAGDGTSGTTASGVTLTPLPGENYWPIDLSDYPEGPDVNGDPVDFVINIPAVVDQHKIYIKACLLYTSDAADE